MGKAGNLTLPFIADNSSLLQEYARDSWAKAGNHTLPFFLQMTAHC